MAELKRYQTSNAQFQSMPTFTTAATDERLASNQRVNKFLDQASQFFGEKSVQYAQDKAIEDAIRNPITADQINQARKTGGNPVTQWLTGGTVYNEAIKKILGQQVAGELRLEFDAANAQALDDVRLGKIQNPEQLLSVLKEPIQAHVEFLSQIDPEIAEGYGARTTASARSNYLQGDTIFRNKQEQQAQLNAQKMSDNLQQDYTNYLRTYPNATIEQKKIYREVLVQSAIDTSFSMSRDQVKLTEDFINQLNKIDDKSVADVIGQNYAGKSIGEVLDILDKDKSNAGQYYRNKDLLERESFIRDISNALSRENSKIAAKDEELSMKMSDAKEYLKRGLSLPPSLEYAINKNMSPNSRYYDTWNTLSKLSKNINKWNETPMDTLMADFNALDAKIKDRTTNETIEELQTHESLGDYLKNIIDGLKNDPVGTSLGRAGDLERLNFLDINNIKDQADKRMFALNEHGSKYGIIKNDPNNVLLTKAEADSFVSQYMQADGNTRIAMLSSIDEGFGNNNSQVMRQLRNAGLPLTAELSSFFKNPRLTEKFLSFDSKEERAVIDKFLTDNSIKMQEIRSDVRKELTNLEDIMMINSNFNASQAAEKMDNLVTVLAYTAAHDIMVNNTDKGKAYKDAAGLINNAFVIHDTYYIPKIYNGNDIQHTIEATGGIIDKAETIKNEYIKKFDPVPFGSSKAGISDKELKRAFYAQIEKTGQWRNTADGSGLIFGVVLTDGSFLPIQNSSGSYLTFKFNDTSYKLPGTDFDMLMIKKSKFYNYGFGLNPEQYRKK